MTTGSARRITAPLALILLFLFGLPVSAQQRRNAQYLEYLNQYRPIAIQQMKEHGIPASITLAQGLFESGAGKSELAVRANNHFGIKKGVGWTGKVYVKSDDRPDDQFRVYANARKSYEDHSQFLKARRYSMLFSLDILDYKGWANGLKQCGYATNPAYAQRLIELIELYDLHDIDLEVAGKTKKHHHSRQDEFTYAYSGRQRVENNGLPCIVARAGDTWLSLSDELGIKTKKLLKYNEAYPDLPIPDGMYVYLHKKANKGPKAMKKKWHKVSFGESMYAISQFYGVRIQKLYKMNFKTEAYIPQAGDLVKVR